jgi:hypothetical protein
LAGQDEDLIEDDEDIRSRARVAAEQGAEQLAEVVGSAIEELAKEFGDKVASLLEENRAGAAAAPVPPRQFVLGALFGSFVFALGVVLGRRH